MSETIAGVVDSPSPTRWDFQAALRRLLASTTALRSDWMPSPSVATEPHDFVPRWRA